MQKTSYLEAVNTCLRVIGEQPVSQVTGAAAPVVGAAVANLNEVSREIQQRGWHFNTEYKVPLYRNSDGKIPVPLNVGRVDVPGTDVVQRGVFLFNLEENTYIFTADVEADVTRLLEWDELPEAARNYIMIRAARKTQERYNQGNSRYFYSEMDEQRALFDLVEAHADTGDYNIFQSWSAYRVIDRRVR